MVVSLLLLLALRSLLLQLLPLVLGPSVLEPHLHLDGGIKRFNDDDAHFLRGGSNNINHVLQFLGLGAC